MPRPRIADVAMAWIDTAPAWLRALIACPCMALVLVGAFVVTYWVIGPNRRPEG